MLRCVRNAPPPFASRVFILSNLGHNSGQRKRTMDNQLYSYSPIVSRPKLAWPNGARIAFYIGLNIEHFQVDKPSTSIFGGTAMLAPDPLNYGWRDYGVRVGIWRMMESLDKYNMRASVLLNSAVC